MRSWVTHRVLADADAEVVLFGLRPRRHRLLLALCARRSVGVSVLLEDAEHFADELSLVGHLVDNVDLVEVDGRVEHREGRVLEDAREDDILEVVQAVRLVDLGEERGREEGRGDDWDKGRGRREVLAVRGAHGREFGVVCGKRAWSARSAPSAL